MSKIAKAGVAILIVSIMVFCCTFLCACNKKNEEPIIPLTIEEIERKVQEDFYNEDGSVKLRWWAYNPNSVYIDIEVWNALKKIESGETQITGFKVTLLKDNYGEYNSYLVEFEPMGFFCGKITEYEPLRFRPFESPYKHFDVAEDNRYYDNEVVLGKFFPEYYAVEKEGTLVDIGSDYLSIKSTGHKEYHHYYVFDNKTKTWSVHAITDEELEEIVNGKA